jgi:excisionase family DNA binding protein
VKKEPTELPVVLLISPTDAAALLSVSKRTLFRLIAAKKIPQPIRYNRKLVRFRAAELARLFTPPEAPPLDAA